MKSTIWRVAAAISILTLSFCGVTDAAHSGAREMLAPKSPYKNAKPSYPRLQALPRMLIDHMADEVVSDVLKATHEKSVAEVAGILRGVYSREISEVEGMQKLEALRFARHNALADVRASAKDHMDRQLPGNADDSLKAKLVMANLMTIARRSLYNMERARTERIRNASREILAGVYLKDVSPAEGIEALEGIGMPEEMARAVVAKITDVLTRIMNGETLAIVQGKVDAHPPQLLGKADALGARKPLFPFYSFFATEKNPRDFGDAMYNTDQHVRVKVGKPGEDKYYCIYFERIYGKGPWIGVCIPSSQQYWTPRSGDMDRWGAALGDSISKNRAPGDTRINPAHLTPDGYQPFVALQEPKDLGKVLDSSPENSLVVVNEGSVDEHYMSFWTGKDGRWYGLKLRSEDRDRRLTATQKNAWEWTLRSPAISRLNPEQRADVQALYNLSIFYRDRVTKAIDDTKLLNLLASFYLQEELYHAVQWDLIQLGMHADAARGYMQVISHKLGRPGEEAGAYMGQGLQEPLAKRWLAETLKSDTLVFSPDGQKVQMGHIAEDGEVQRRDLTADELAQYANIIKVVRASSDQKLLRDQVRQLWQPNIPGFDKDFILEKIGRTEIWIVPESFTIAGGYYAHAAFHYGQRKYAGGKRVAKMTAAQFAQDRAQEAMHHAYKDPAHRFIEHDRNHEEAMQAILDEHAAEVERERWDGYSVAIQSLRRLIQNTPGVVRRLLAYNMQVESEGDSTPLPKDGKVVIFVGDKVFIQSLQAVSDMPRGTLSDRMREAFAFGGPMMIKAPMYFISDAVLSQTSNEELRRTILSDVKGGYMAGSPSEISALDDTISDAMPREEGYQWGEKIERAVDGAISGKYGDAYDKVKARPSIIVINIDDMDHAVHLRAALERHAADSRVRIVLISNKGMGHADGTAGSSEEMLREYVKLLRLRLGQDYHAVVSFKQLQERSGSSSPENALLNYLNETFAGWAPPGKGIEAVDVGFINSNDSAVAIPLKSSAAGQGILEVKPRKPAASQLTDMRKVMGFTRMALHLRQIQGVERFTMRDLIAELRKQFSDAECSELITALATTGMDSQDIAVMDYLTQPSAMPSSNNALNAAASSFKEVLLAA